MDSIPHNKNSRATKIGKIVEFFIKFYRFTELEIKYHGLSVALKNHKDA